MMADVNYRPAILRGLYLIEFQKNEVAVHPKRGCLRSRNGKCKMSQSLLYHAFGEWVICVLG